MIGFNDIGLMLQGIYWAGERIWADDTVRVKKSRSDLPTDILPLPKDNNGVVLRVQYVRPSLIGCADLQLD